MLKELKLACFSLHLEAFQQQAIDQTWSHTDFLAKLCEQELARRFQARILKWTREAKLPAGKSFASLKMEHLPKSVKHRVLQLKDNHQWALQADNILLIGLAGVGKSHLAAALSHQLIQSGVLVKWLTATALVQQLQQAKQELALMAYMTRLDKYRVIVIDDIGYVK